MDQPVQFEPGTSGEREPSWDLLSSRTTREILKQTSQQIGLYHPGLDSGEGPKSTATGCLLVFLSVIGLAVVGLTLLDLGVGVALLSSLVAFIPVSIYLSAFLWLDRFDPEPPGTLAFAFLWGASISVLVSAILNDFFGLAWGDRLTGIVSAPIVEEACKGMGVLMVALLFRRDFDSIVDGIVYAGVVALGFATIENIGYYGKSFATAGAGGLLGTFIVRGVLAPFSHVLFGAMTGVGIGIARESHEPKVKFAAPMLGYAGAMLLHALWNLLASFDSSLFFMGYFFLEVPLFLAFVGAIAYLVRREGRILRQTLAREVERGLISAHQLDIAVSVFRRTSWLLGALGDGRRFRARRQFLRAVAKLGLCRWHQARAIEADRTTDSLPLIGRLQAEVYYLQGEIV